MPEQVSISVVSSGVNIAAGAVTSVTAGTGLTGGNITSSGTIAADFAVSGSATANKVVEATDSRLSNARTPTTHGSSHGVSGSDPIPADGISQSQVASLTSDLAAKVPTTRQVIAGTGLGGGGALSTDVTLSVSYGTSSTTACVGNDARLTNARTPDVHASTHTAAGSDPLTLSQAQITNLTSDLNLKASTTHAATHATGGTDVLTLGQAQITGLTASLAAKALGATTMTAGTGLTGGGDLSANRSFSVAYGTTGTTATVGNDSRLSFIAAGTGATTRTLQNKLRDVISVKDFGAIGDGSTDDTAAINTAIDAALAGNGALYFPTGTYVLSSRIISANNQAHIGPKTLTKNLVMFGDNATIKSMSATPVVYMLLFSANNFGLTLNGLTFDLNQIAWVGMRIEDLAISGGFGTKTNEVNIDRCVFENSFKTTTTLEGWQSNAGVMVLGGYRNVKITNTTSRNHSRALNTNTYGSSSTLGILIEQNNADSVNAFPQNILIDSCTIENIINSETTRSTQNLDCDGISMFGGFTDSTAFAPCKATVTNNTFINCKGRALKFQCDEVIVTNNQTRLAINCCGTTPAVYGFTLGSVFDIQGCTGQISNNIFHYEQPNGTGNPFSPTNTDGDEGGYAISVGFSGVATAGLRTKRPKSFIIENNTVYNNVPEAKGKLQVFIQAGEIANLLASLPNQLPGFLSVKGNRVLGGTVIDWMQLGLRSTANNAQGTTPGTTNGVMYVNLIDNFASKMDRGFLACGSNVNFLNNFITMIGNVNATGTVRHLINTSSPTTIQEAQVTALGNCGIGLEASKEGPTTTSMLTRVDGIAPVVTQEGPFGGMSIQTAIIQPSATHTFPLRSVNPQGFTCLLTGNNMNAVVNAMFTSTASTVISNWNAGNAVFPASGFTPPAPTAFQVAIGRTSGSGGVTVTIGSGWSADQRFTLFTFG